PTTTTSSKEAISSPITTSITLLSPIDMLWDSNPIKENTNVAPSGADNEYLPSKSVVVPVVVPDTETVTPGINSPLASVTVPVTVTSIACAISTACSFLFSADFT